jgi:lysophospholipase L1-like esterase
LCFGDSNTYGLVPNSDKRFDYTTRYPGVLSCELGDDFLVIEEGLAGRTTVYPDHRYGRRGADTLPVCLESHSPLDFVVIMLGTNDCKKMNARSVGEAREAIGVILDIALEYVSRPSDIILVSPVCLRDNTYQLDRDFDERSVEISKQLSSAYGNAAFARGCRFLDADTVATTSPEDGQHLDENGHRALALALSDIISGAAEEKTALCAVCS